MGIWSEILTQHNASVDDNDRCTVSQAETGDCIVTPLTHLGLFDVIGPEAEKFLQGQLSCDVAIVSGGRSLLGSHCNIKGSMISLSRVMAVTDGFWLRSERNILAQAQTNLKKYMIFSKAESQDRSEEVLGLGIQGANAAEALATAGVPVPGEEGETVAIEGGVLVRVPGDRFEAWLSADNAVALLTELLKSAVLAGSDSWQASEIAQAIPTLHPETLETFIPQMTNLQALDGVSFTKGCYTGQEIVTRLQHRGKLKRPMYRLSFSGASAPVAGSLIDSPDRKGVGTVVDSVKTSADGGELLAVIIKESFDDADLALTIEGINEPLSRLDIPYTLDPELFEAKR